MFIRVLPWTHARFSSTIVQNKALFSVAQELSIKRDNAAPKLKGNIDRVRLLSTASPQPKAPEPPVGVSEPFIGVKIPSPEVDSELPVQVPYVPDFWDSAKLAPDVPVSEVPKVVVLGDVETHHSGGPSHTLEDVDISVEKDSTRTSKVERTDSLFDDIAEDLYLPSVQEMRNSFRKIFS